MKTKLLSIAALGAAALVVVSQTKAATPGFDVNDLNIMFAAVKNADGTTSLSPNIPIGTHGIAGLGFTDESLTAKQLLSLPLFDNVEAFATSRGIGTPASGADGTEPHELLFSQRRQGFNFHVGAILDNWRVVSLRYDSCFPLVDEAHPENCIEHIRLIAQPISPRQPTGEDTTMHLLYAVRGMPAGVPQKGIPLTTKFADGRESIIAQLRALKAMTNGATNGAPMGPHPTLVQQANVNGAFAAAVKNFVLTNCSPDKLMVITYMGLQGRGPEPWIFFGGDANTGAAQKGQWVAQPQPTFFKEGNTQDFQITFSNINPAVDQPKQGKILNRPQAFTDATGAIVKGSDDHVKKLFDAPATTLSQFDLNVVNRLEKPRVHAPHNTDCFSCHATNSQMLSKKVAVDPNGDGFIPTLGVTSLIDKSMQQTTSWNTRNWGYFGGKPTVSYLTAASADDVVQFTNKQLSLDNPGVQCATPAQALNLRKCTLGQDAFTTQNGNYEACLAAVGCRRSI